MRGLALLRELSEPADTAEPVAKLLQLADVLKARTLEHTDVPLDVLQVDHDYQRPPDREKIAAIVEHLRGGGQVDPIRVNRRHDGSLWITDGQHRAAAAAICGHHTIPARITNVQQWAEAQETEIVAKADSGRIPAGDPRRGRIHPGEWTKENNPAALKKAAEEAHSHVERTVIHHRLSQLRGHHAVAGRLTDKELGEHKQALEQARRGATVKGSRAAVLADEEFMGRTRSDAETKVLGYRWHADLVQAALDKHPEVRALQRKLRRAHEKEDKARAAASAAYGDEKRYARARENFMDARQARLNVDAELTNKFRELTGTPTPRNAGSEHSSFDRELAKRTIGVDFDAHRAKHRAKIEREIKPRVTAAAEIRQERAQQVAERLKAKLDAHREAAGLAAEKARQAKQTTPRFERQTLAGDFIGSLKKHPGHPRAIFLEDSILADGLAYSEWTRPLKPVTQRVCTAFVPRNPIETWPGITDQNYGQLIRAASTPVRLSRKTLTRADLERHLKEHAPAATATLRRRFIELAMMPHNLANARYQEVRDWKRSATAEFRTFAEVPAEHEDQLVAALHGMGAKVADNEVYLPDYRSWADRHMDHGKRFLVDLGRGRSVSYVPHYSVGTKQVTKYRHTFTYGGLSPQKKAALLKKLDQIVANRGWWTHDLSRAKALIENAPAKPVSITAETESFERARPHGQEFFQQIKGRRWPGGFKDLMYATGGDAGVAGRFLRDEILQHSREKGEGRKTEPHKAPFSERGVLHLDGMTPAEAVKLIGKLGAAKGLTPEVPYNLIYRGQRRIGRVHPQHSDYATGEHTPKVPGGIGIFHGLTGHGDPAEQVQRIVRDGGIKAIAERRRLGRRQGGLSVKGDTGSGIDQYVFTTSQPHYGHGSVIFQMKPSALKRRDIAFAPRDYGGGGDRWKNYNAHAKAIGQGRLYDPPAHAARQRHLDTHAHKNLAEVLLKHEIPWSDVDTLWVHPEHHKKIDRMIRAAKRKGLVPEHVRVVNHEHNSSSLIADRLRQLSVDDD